MWCRFNKSWALRSTSSVFPSTFVSFHPSSLFVELQLEQIHLACWAMTETSEILVSREFSRIFWRDFVFHFSLLEKSESYLYFTLFSREKRVKSGAGYNLTSIFVPNCISKYCQISSKHQPQNIGQISVLKSWPNPVLNVWTKLQLKKSDKKFSVDILTKLQLLYQSVNNMFLVSSNIDNCSNINNFSIGIFAYQTHISQVWNWRTDKAIM